MVSSNMIKTNALLFTLDAIYDFRHLKPGRDPLPEGYGENENHGPEQPVITL